MRQIAVIIAVGLGSIALAYAGVFLGLILWTRFFVINAGFLVFLTIVSDQINIRAVGQHGRAVIIPYIISTILKLIMSAVFLILLVKENMEDAREIVYSFLVFYAIFSATEIIIVNQRTRPQKF